MKPFRKFIVYQADCLQALKELESESVHCCVTSPPYFGLRSYLPDVVRLRDNIPDTIRAKVLAELSELEISPIP